MFMNEWSEIRLMGTKGKNGKVRKTMISAPLPLGIFVLCTL